MAELYKTLGQVAPSATTATLLYGVPAFGQAVLSTVTVCNRGITASSFRISVRVAAEAENNKQYIYYDVPIPAKDTFAATIGITLGALDEIWIYGENGDLSFQVWGTEIT